MDPVVDIEHDLRAPEGEKLTELVCRVNAPALAILDAHVKPRAAGKFVRQERDRAQFGFAARGRHADHLLPDRPAIGDLDGQRRRTEIPFKST
ncbi:MAG: hypothetical protein ACK56I_37005, partial [bacterium]